MFPQTLIFNLKKEKPPGIENLQPQFVYLKKLWQGGTKELAITTTHPGPRMIRY